MERQPRPAETVPAVEPDARTKGGRTRECILDVAYAAIVRKGFAGRAALPGNCWFAFSPRTTRSWTS